MNDPGCNLSFQVYEEIVTNISEGKRYPDLNDRPKLPMCQATLQETLRLSSLVPLGGAHKTTCDTTVAGCAIPRETQVLPSGGAEVTGALRTTLPWGPPMENKFQDPDTKTLTNVLSSPWLKKSLNFDAPE